MKQCLGFRHGLRLGFAVIFMGIFASVAHAAPESRSTPRRKPAPVKKTTPAKKSKTTGSTFAVVVSQSSQISARPDLDAPVISIVPRGTRIPISRGRRGDFAGSR